MLLVVLAFFHLNLLSFKTDTKHLVMDSEGTDPVKSNNGNGSTTATIINSSGSWGKVTKNIQPNTNINQRRYIV